MENSSYLIQINLPGGIVPAGKLQGILHVLQSLDIRQVSFGHRQQLLISANYTQLKNLDLQLAKLQVKLEVNTNDYPNLVSSYVTEEVFGSTDWLSEGVYKDILDSFNYNPRLKINIVDREQNLIPFFTGNFNYISSSISNYWHLHLRFPKTNKIYAWPRLVYSADIAEMSSVLEKIMMTEHQLFYGKETADGDLLVKMAMDFINLSSQVVEEHLVHTDFQLPFYEGMNAYGNQQFWLGIYRRNEFFQVDFLIELCQLCLDYRIGQLYTTPWKSILIKNIPSNSRKNWTALLNKHRINVRHAANELNWQFEDRCAEAIQLKWDLVRSFEEADLRTSKLCFAIKTTKQSGLFGSIVIQKKEEKNRGIYYEVWHTESFNPNSKNFMEYGKAYRITELSSLLIRLCHYYYTLNSQYKTSALESARKEQAVVLQSAQIYQCKHCFTRYDPTYGDAENYITAGTPFNEIKEYHCITCHAPKTDFELVMGDEGV